MKRDEETKEREKKERERKCSGKILSVCLSASVSCRLLVFSFSVFVLSFPQLIDSLLVSQPMWTRKQTRAAFEELIELNLSRDSIPPPAPGSKRERERREVRRS